MVSPACKDWIFQTLVACLIGIGVSLIVYYQVITNQDPIFTVDHASVNGFNLTSDGHLTAFFDVGLWAHNPNHKLKFQYWNIKVSVFKDKQNLATDTLSGFTQKKYKVTIVKAAPVARNVVLKAGPKYDFGVESGMGYVMFDAFLTSMINRDRLEVDCKGIMVNFTVGGSSTCVNCDDRYCSLRMHRHKPNALSTY